MSLVGPRPEDPSISKTWPVQMARELLSVRPGITSPASVVYRDEESMLHAGEVMRKYLHELSPDKMRLDQLYIRYRSLWLDIDVILWTVLVLIPKIKSYSPPEQLLYVGPITRLIQRYLSWFVLDSLVVFVSISLTAAAVNLFTLLDFGWLRSLEMALGFAMLYNIAGVALNTNRINWPKATSWESGRLWISWLVATATVLGTHFYLGFTESSYLWRNSWRCAPVPPWHRIYALPRAVDRRSLEPDIHLSIEFAGHSRARVNRGFRADRGADRLAIGSSNLFGKIPGCRLYR